jgi:hypothetical protein
LLKNGTSLRKIAKICKVDRNTLARFISLKGMKKDWVILSPPIEQSINNKIETVGTDDAVALSN